MKIVLKALLLSLILIITSCSSTKKVSNAERDGSSYENAIIAKSISSEYEYVAKVCPECRFVQQSLVFQKGKPYDILKFKDGEGKDVEYYFDISEFFGKGF